ncbi:MAG: tRNA threonylcarbamoyladenosine biosynthesis protein TsaB [Moorella sp. (in: firmicutes)]|uniref:tRNA (adenosine(37)-N6)-threonylcarbamoyltransferase complex dimerization subunit type 1 TsaB n=1 Tax=unclassified Neomoorella TaxID=2676739 RepID=UPI0010FFC6BC|nr:MULTISPECIES: tRNA (adenosine(37)-N6)-threonylcarbamoyltransferase complex dimerization subunit type 1 TsaB [unclassified Moorella (in: firmicutes)]MDK2817480.1 tRNA threonylcarbamoyladenosine biosynthesis protein TsaB [Moorella sp. (in: firmicutes)]MDK2894049.1 tRNA threonylcarbamoyladenosine biosynthesis protein TsaB [Moorella sp. (in: firmicutes)]GEA14085.1 tRNA (adenosine(37)-N6)-threonylcarbamoyltransferase complex dimerization subunit type 1 TsaB [Moorella sp. E308F]GEA18539.1 tRNA (ad
MLVLGLDSATQVAGVALIDGDRLVAELFFNTRKNHSQRLLPMIAALLREAGVKLADLDGLAVALGPGSFTGLRIGLATVKGLAHAARKPVAGIPTLDGLAWNAWEVPGLVCPVLYARRQEVYTALYRWQEGELCRLTPYQAVDPCLLVESLKSYTMPVYFLGDGVAPYREVWQQLGPRARFLPSTSALPRAAQIARLGRERLLAGQADNLFQLKPLYLRPSPAERQVRSKCKSCP